MAQPKYCCYGLGTLKLVISKPLRYDSSDYCFFTSYYSSGATVNIKFIDTETNQLIADKNVRF